MRKLSLRIKITLFIGLIMSFAYLILTINSIISAKNYYSVLVEKDRIQSLGDERAETMISEEELLLSDDSIPFFTATKHFSNQGISLMIATIFISVGFTYWITGKLLRPLTNLTVSIRNIDQQKLYKRVEFPYATGEVQELTESFNNMMSRLEESFEVQKSFAANAAHELKTPLTIIKTSLEVLELDDEPTVEDYKEFVYNTKSGLERLVKTVEALLDMASGSAKGVSEFIKLQPLLNQIICELHPSAEQRGITFIFSGDCQDVYADHTLIYRVFFNLIENAIKYNKENGTITITLSNENGKASIKIADNGIGMSDENSRHVFEPFYRADQSRSQKISGSGLGLSVVKLIVEKYHGSIELKSVKDLGTTIKIIL